MSIITERKNIDRNLLKNDNYVGLSDLCTKEYSKELIKAKENIAANEIKISKFVKFFEEKINEIGNLRPIDKKFCQNQIVITELIVEKAIAGLPLFIENIYNDLNDHTKDNFNYFDTCSDLVQKLKDCVIRFKDSLKKLIKLKNSTDIKLNVIDNLKNRDIYKFLFKINPIDHEFLKLTDSNYNKTNNKDSNSALNPEAIDNMNQYKKNFSYTTIQLDLIYLESLLMESNCNQIMNDIVNLRKKFYEKQEKIYKYAKEDIKKCKIKLNKHFNDYKMSLKEYKIEFNEKTFRVIHDD